MTGTKSAVSESDSVPSVNETCDSGSLTEAGFTDNNHKNKLTQVLAPAALVKEEQLTVKLLLQVFLLCRFTDQNTSFGAHMMERCSI